MLETRITELTAAVVALTAAMAGRTAAPAAPTPAAPPAPTFGQPAAPLPNGMPGGPFGTQPAAPPAAPPPSFAPPTAPGAPFNDLAGCTKYAMDTFPLLEAKGPGKGEIITQLIQHLCGSTSINDLPPAAYPQFYAELEKIKAS